MALLKRGPWCLCCWTQLYHPSLQEHLGTFGLILARRYGMTGKSISRIVSFATQRETMLQLQAICTETASLVLTCTVGRAVVVETMGTS